MWRSMVCLHMPFQQILHGEGVIASRRRTAVSPMRPRQPRARSAQHGAARAPRGCVTRAHVRRALRLRADGPSVATAGSAHPHLVLATVRYCEVHLKILQNVVQIQH